MEIIVTGLAIAVAIHYYRLSRSLLVCSVFGCLTRQGIERRKPKPGSVVVFLDVDDMKGANGRGRSLNNALRLR